MATLLQDVQRRDVCATAGNAAECELEAARVAKTDDIDTQASQPFDLYDDVTAALLAAIFIVPVGYAVYSIWRLL